MKADAAASDAAVTESPTEVLQEAAAAPERAGLETFLPASVEQPSLKIEQPIVGVRSARLLSHNGRNAVVALRGDDEPREVPLDSEVDAAIVAEALETGERVLVEADEEGQLAVVGVLRSRVPEKLVLRANVIELDADQEVLLRSGKGAVRIREDGDIEVVGSRISAASRGLFRLVGKMLRLN
jgi:hypothetical protein